MNCKDLLDKIVLNCNHILKENLVGVYLHGSLAMGCFHVDISDIDIIFVVEKPLEDSDKSKLMEAIVASNAVSTKKGLEVSVVLKEHCKNFIYPTPFELHFSSTHLPWYKSDSKDYIQKMLGTDPDLAAHFTIIKARGIVLCGESIDEVFGAVPSEYYLDSIRLDVASAEEDILDSPIYITLNLCRVLAYVKTHKILSKKEGGEWGLINIDSRFHELIFNALSCYNRGESMELDQESELALQYCEYMRQCINEEA